MNKRLDLTKVCSALALALCMAASAMVGAADSPDSRQQTSELVQADALFARVGYNTRTIAMKPQPMVPQVSSVMNF